MTATIKSQNPDGWARSPETISGIYVHPLGEELYFAKLLPSLGIAVI